MNRADRYTFTFAVTFSMAALTLAVLLLTFSATKALAAPSLAVTLERDSAVFPEVTRSDERVDYTAKVQNNGADPTSAGLELEIELPGGGTFPFKTKAGEDWSCTAEPPVGAQNATVSCTSSKSGVGPGGEYPPVTVIAGLTPALPDPASAEATASGGGAAASASVELSFPVAPAVPFGVSNFTAAVLDPAGKDYKDAGGHGFKVVSEIALNRKRALEPESIPYLPIAQTRQVIAQAPRGFVGNVLALPELCPTTAEVKDSTCPPGSVVGGIEIQLSGLPGPALTPIYAIKPEFGAPAQFAFTEPLGNLFTFTPRLRAADGYAIDFELAPAPEVNFIESTVTLCDFGGLKAGIVFTGCKEKETLSANPKPLFTNPTRCGVDLFTRLRLNSWEDPAFVEAPPFQNPTIEKCDQVRFDPTMTLKPTSRQADSPTGLDVELSLPTKGLEEPNGIAQANLKQVEIDFPPGMAINASAGQGLEACSLDQVGFDRVNGKLVPNDNPVACPQSSKIGTAEVETPLLEDTLEGAAYIAKQGDVNGSLIGLYLVFDSPKNGILVKLPATVSADERTGQLTAMVEESPEAPFSHVRMSFPGGPRANLITPPSCGDYDGHDASHQPLAADLSPWTGAAAVAQATSFALDQGPGGGGCPSGALNPKLNAGTEHPTAGKTSPFVLNLTREDGTQRFTGLNLTTPPGLSAFLKDVPYCPQSAIDAAKAREALGGGALELNSPSCPAASQIGTASAGAGAGPEPLFVNTGKAYLAGPYKGAPVSLVLIAPAVAGPLDLGNVVVQTALKINPETAQVSALSDPVPTMLHGILLDVRDIRVAFNRPNFTLNPTNCEPLAINAEVKGETTSTQVSNRFQADGCGNLAFKPRLGVRLFGGTHRGAHPRLKGTLQAGPGETNIGRAAVTVPRSEFLDQGHIRTICTRVQFAANACPKGSIYGHATATTPLLGYPVEGPVYLRSSSHKLPDLVVDLHGPSFQPIEAIVVGRIDSVKGQIRTTFESAPDVPLTKFVLSMQGGKKGLLVNSRNICASTNKATVKLTGQDGAPFNTRPVLKNGKCQQQRGGKKGHGRKTRR